MFFPKVMCGSLSGRNKHLQLTAFKEAGVSRVSWPVCLCPLPEVEAFLSRSGSCGIHFTCCANEVFYVHGQRWAGLRLPRWGYQPQRREVTANDNNWENLKLNCSGSFCCCCCCKAGIKLKQLLLNKCLALVWSWTLRRPPMTPWHSSKVSTSLLVITPSISI